METRKVQLTGGSTYTVSLPKSWAKEMGVTKNSLLGLMVQDDGSILVTPYLKDEMSEKMKLFNEAELGGYDSALRQLVGAYVMGYDKIEIHSTKRISHEVRKAVRSFTDTVIGPEVVDDGLNSMTLTDLSDTKKLSFDLSVRRMYLIISSMMESLELVLENHDLQIASEVIDRDRELNRLNWLVARQYNKLMKDPQMIETLGTTKERGMNLMLISRILERIGDHADRIANGVIDMKGDLSDGNKREIIFSLKMSKESLDMAMNSLFKKDMAMANMAMKQGEKVEERYQKMIEMVVSQKTKDTLLLGYMVESIFRIARYSKDISECVINILVDME